MKNRNYYLVLAFTILIFNLTFCKSIYSQNFNQTQKIAVLSVKVTDMGINSNQAAKLLRNALIEIDTFEVIDEFDMQDVSSDLKFKNNECYSTKCLVNLGQQLNVDLMLSGSVEKLLDKNIVSLRIIDVKSSEIIKRKLIEFVNIEGRIKEMIKITLNEMMGRKNDVNIKKALMKENQYESNINIPEVEKLSLSGPRIGVSFFTGNDAEIFKSSEINGGFDGRPFFFQFGYQFEVSYLNAGMLQALFEILPMISGVDQGTAIPSLTLLNGIRLNTNGFEFAIGPSFILTQKAEGYYDESDNWNLGSIPEEDTDKGYIIKKRLDSRGDRYLDTGLVIGFGKSFKSGKVNFPVNAYMVMKKKDFQFGVSLGFNASSFKKSKK